MGFGIASPVPTPNPDSAGFSVQVLRSGPVRATLRAGPEEPPPFHMKYGYVGKYRCQAHQALGAAYTYDGDYVPIDVVLLHMTASLYPGRAGVRRDALSEFHGVSD